jgi:tyrosinase
MSETEPQGAGGAPVIVSKKYTSSTFSLKGLDINFYRADIEFHDVDHSGPTFEARVFLNNPGADATTPKNLQSGYAGSFHIFGHGGCFGDEGHCEVVPRRAYDPRPAHPLSPARKVVIASDAVRQAMGAGDEVTITVVPVILSLNDRSGTDDVLKFEKAIIVTYR